MSAADMQQAPRREWPVRFSFGLVAGLVLAAAIVILIVQNTQSVTVRWLVLDGQQPLWAVLVITGLAGVALAKLAGLARRHRNQG